MTRLIGTVATVCLGLTLLATANAGWAQSTEGGSILVPGSDESSTPKDKPKDKPLDSETPAAPEKKDFVPGEGGGPEADKKETAPDAGSEKPEPKPEAPDPDADKKTPEPGEGLEGRVKTVEQRIAEARSEIASLRDQVAQNTRAIEELRMLIEADRDVEPKPGEGLPPLNADCKGDELCVECLLKVEADIDKQLRLFEKLRAIYSRYKLNHETAMLLGDTLSGYHNLTQTVWGATKVQLLADIKKVQSAYDNKFQEFMGDIDKILDDADACLPEGAAPVSKSYDARILKNMLTVTYKRTD